MNESELYAEYGRLMIQAEIIQAQINNIKAKIAENLNAKDVGKKVDETKRTNKN